MDPRFHTTSFRTFYKDKSDLMSLFKEGVPEGFYQRKRRHHNELRFPLFTRVGILLTIKSVTLRHKFPNTCPSNQMTIHKER